MDGSEVAKKTISSVEDLEDIEVKIVILAHNTSKLASTVHFLSRRGWPTTVFSNVGKAIEAIQRDPPNFVLLSMNHPSPKMDKLPALIEQTFNITPVLFAEAGDSTVLAKLQNAKVKYKLIGTTSGPAMHRYLRKVLMELFGPAVIASSGSANANAATDGSEKDTVISGNKDGSLGSVHVMGQANSQPRGATVIQSGESGKSEGPTYFGEGGSAKGGRRSLNDLLAATRPQGKQTNPSSDAARQQLQSLMQTQDPETDDFDEQALLNLAAQNKAGDGNGSFNPNASQASGSSNVVPINKNATSTSGSQGANLSTGGIGGQSSALGNQQSGSGNAQPGRSGSNSQGDQIGNLSAKAGQQISALKNSASSHALQPKRASGPESLLEKAFRQTLDVVTRGASKKSAAKFGDVKKIFVVPLENGETYGYGVVAMQDPKNKDQPFLDLFVATLTTKITELKVPVRQESAFVIPIPELSLPALIQFGGEFGDTQSFENDVDVCFGFFNTPYRIQPQEQDSDSMSQVPVESISTDIPVNFKAYLRMSRNDKYLLYLKEGSRILPRQKESLKEANISVFHVEKKDMNKFKAYTAVGFFSRLAQNLLSDQSSD